MVFNAVVFVCMHVLCIDVCLLRVLYVNSIQSFYGVHNTQYEVFFSCRAFSFGLIFETEKERERDTNGFELNGLQPPFVVIFFFNFFWYMYYKKNAIGFVGPWGQDKWMDWIGQMPCLVIYFIPFKQHRCTSMCAFLYYVYMCVYDSMCLCILGCYGLSSRDAYTFFRFFFYFYLFSDWNKCGGRFASACVKLYSHTHPDSVKNCCREFARSALLWLNTIQYIL